MSRQSQGASDPHLKEIRNVTPSAQGCEDCLRARHPIIQSFEPGEDWRWCYVHEAVV